MSVGTREETTGKYGLQREPAKRYGGALFIIRKDTRILGGEASPHQRSLFCNPNTLGARIKSQRG